VCYWLVAERARYAARALLLERLRQFVGQARRGASQAFPTCQSMERERGARQ
jgi:hypothetical protein